jgi:hypothetical protein
MKVTVALNEPMRGELALGTLRAVQLDRVNEAFIVSDEVEAFLANHRQRRHLPACLARAHSAAMVSGAR